MNNETIANEITELVEAAIRAGMENEPRTVQARAGIIGPSDIGFCRQKNVLTMREVVPTDSTDPWAITVGVAVHRHIEQYLKELFDDWIIEEAKVTATLPRTGAEISGTPDIIIPSKNLVLDIKTVDGLKSVMNYGPSQSHRFQRHLYAMGAIAAGLLDGDKPVYVGNLYVNVSRTQGEQKLYADIREFDEALTDEIDTWVEDTIYAVRHGEDASRDIAPAVCERICQFYTACRGSLPSAESELFTDPQVVNAIDMYVKGRDLEKEGASMKREASTILSGLNGSDGTYQVRTVQIAEQDVPGFTRRASTRLDVRRLRK